MLKRILEAILGLTVAREIPLAKGESVRRRPVERRADRGAGAEEAACALLRSKGYRILCRNRVNTFGELDIVARHGRYIVFAEVRSRAAGSAVSAKDSLTRQKRRALLRAGELFLRQHRLEGQLRRFDLVTVEFEGGGEGLRVEHYENIVEEADW